MVAHVGDFGLAKFVHVATQNSAINQSSSVGIRGTIGYTAPEYGIGSEVSTYGDVYSYGILILEMFTGKKPTDEMFKDIENLHNYVKAKLPDKVVELADPLILKEIEEEEEEEEEDVVAERNIRSNKVKECLISIMQIGVACSVELTRERMNMTDVVAQLQSIRDDFLGNGIHRLRAATSTHQR